MTLYFDTSALVKKYAKEEGSKEILALFRTAEAVAISKVGYAEMLAAFYRKNREQPTSPRALRKMLDTFKKDWQTFISVNISAVLNSKLEDLIAKHALRGFDAIHLASAAILKDQLNGELIFVCADRRLHSAAKKERFETFPPELPMDQ